MEQCAVDFGRTADRIQMNASKSATLSASGRLRGKDRALLYTEGR